MDDSKITWTPLSFWTPEWSECTAKGSAVPKVFPLQTCAGLRTAGSHDVPCGFASPCETESPKPIGHGKPGLLGGPKIGILDQFSGHMDPPKSKCCAFRMENRICHDGWRASYSAARLGIAIDLARVGGLIILIPTVDPLAYLLARKWSNETDSNFSTETYLGWEQFLELGGIHDVKLTPLPDQGPWDSERESAAREVRHKRRLV